MSQSSENMTTTTRSMPSPSSPPLPVSPPPPIPDQLISPSSPTDDMLYPPVPFPSPPLPPSLSLTLALLAAAPPPPPPPPPPPLLTLPPLPPSPPPSNITSESVTGNQSATFNNVVPSTTDTSISRNTNSEVQSDEEPNGSNLGLENSITSEKAKPISILQGQSDELYNRLSKLLDCPVCLDVIRPGTRSVGACINGHVFCPMCATKLGNQREIACPVCRTERMDLKSHNFLASTLIDILSGMTEYKCQHPTCNTMCMGKDVLTHEKVCVEKPLRCPKHSCRESVPYYKLANKEHPCMYQLYANPTESSETDLTWEMVINMEDLFCFDEAQEKVSVGFQPMLLLPPKPKTSEGASAVEPQKEQKETNSAHSTRQRKKPKLDDTPVKLDHPEVETRKNKDMSNHYRLYLNAIQCAGGNGIIMFICSLETKEDVPKEISEKKFTISANIATYVGIIGTCSKVQPVSYGTALKRNDQGIYLSRADLYCFIDHTSTRNCNMCTGTIASLFPHFHIKVKEIKA